MPMSPAERRRLMDRAENLEDELDPYGAMSRNMERTAANLEPVQNAGGCDCISQVAVTVFFGPVFFPCSVTRLIANKYQCINPNSISSVEECAYGGSHFVGRYHNVDYQDRPLTGTGCSKKRVDMMVVCWSVVFAASSLTLLFACPHQTAHAATMHASSLAMPCLGGRSIRNLDRRSSIIAFEMR